MNQLTLFNQSAKQSRDKAFGQVLSNAASWVDLALETIPSISGEVTGEDIRNTIEKIIGEPHHHNTWGAVINTAIKRGLLFRTGEYRQMCGPKSHARRTPVYRTRQ